MSHWPRVSILTPSYNQGGFIERTIRSVLSQGYGNLQYLVMDGASTDGTLEILRSYRDRHPDIMRFVSENDRGQTHALNKAVAQTDGEIIGWVNSDDTFLPGAIQTCVRYLTDHPEVEMVYGDANFIDADDQVIARCAHVEPFNFSRLVHYSDFIVQPACFFRRRAFDAVGGADESLHYTMDYDLFLKIGSRFPVQYLPLLLANYRWLGWNKSAVGGNRRIDEIRRITAAFGAYGLPAYTRLEAAFLAARLAWGEAGNGHIAQATTHVLRGAGEVLGSPRVWRSLLSPACWKVMWTGQLLRRRTNTGWCVIP